MSAFLASLFGKETLVGLDIGSASIKAVQVEAHKDSFRVVRAAQQKTPAKAVRDGIVVDRDAVAAALRQMLKAAGISVTGAVMAVSGPTVTVRQIRMPKMNEAALRKSVRYEAGKYITANIDDAALAFDILGMVGDESSQMEVMLVAAPREMVDSRVDTLERAGLEAVAIDLEAFALQRALVDAGRSRWEDGSLRALVDMGAAHTEVTILAGATFVFTRSIPIAGDAFTDALRNHLRVEEDAAERRKMDVDMTALIEGTGSPDVVEAARAIQSVLDELLREIRRSINYYQSQLPEGTPVATLNEIVLSGGSSQLGGLAPYMTARLATEARVANAFDNPIFQANAEAGPWLREQAPRLGAALGLAIKEYMPSPMAPKA